MSVQKMNNNVSHMPRFIVLKIPCHAQFLSQIFKALIEISINSAWDNLLCVSNTFIKLLLWCCFVLVSNSLYFLSEIVFKSLQGSKIIFSFTFYH